MPEAFDAIYRRAVKRKGKTELEASFAKPRSRAALARLEDGEILSAMGKAVFSAGFNWRVVDQKWPAFLEAFSGLEPARVAALSDKDFDRYAQDTRLIRHRGKLESLRANAAFLLTLADEHGSAAKVIAAWPGEDITGLWLLMKAKGSRLGGATGPRVLRALGKDTFILTPDVQQGLKQAKVPFTSATSKAGLAAAQEAFNAWHEESGLALCAISRVVACSV